MNDGLSVDRRICELHCNCRGAGFFPFKVAATPTAAGGVKKLLVVLTKSKEVGDAKVGRSMSFCRLGSG